MNYYLLEGSLKPDTPSGDEFKPVLEEHLAYLQSYVEQGKILLSGPKTEGRGGVILLRLEEKESLEDFCAKDPFVIAGVQDYHIVQFQLNQIQNYALPWKSI